MKRILVLTLAALVCGFFLVSPLYAGTTTMNISAYDYAIATEGKATAIYDPGSWLAWDNYELTAKVTNVTDSVSTNVTLNYKDKDASTFQQIKSYGSGNRSAKHIGGTWAANTGTYLFAKESSNSVLISVSNYDR